MTQLFQNNFSTTLAAECQAGDTTLQLVATSLLPVTAPHHILLTLESSDKLYNEIVKVTAHAGSSPSVTVVRAQEGTTARTWAVGT